MTIDLSLTLRPLVDELRLDSVHEEAANSVDHLERVDGIAGNDVEQLVIVISVGKVMQRAAERSLDAFLVFGIAKICAHVSNAIWS